jgi:hypothetical protein
MDANEGLSLTKSLYEAAEAAIRNQSHMDAASVRQSAKKLNKLLLTLARTQNCEKTRATIELDTLRAEMHAELVDREAHAARVSERQRFLFERQSAQHGQAAAADRAAQSAAFVEAALVSLCPHPTSPSPGCKQLDQDATQ